MSSSNISDLQVAANNLNYVAMMFIRCYAFTALPFGIIGHLLSIYVFTRPTLRSNSCARYFLAATIIGLISTCHTLPMRVIQSGFENIDPGAHSVIFCKMTWFLLNSFRGLSSWFIVLASIDRFFCSSSSTNIRAWSSIRVANWTIPITIILGLVAYVHVAIYFNVGIVPATQKPTCYPLAPPGTYRIFLSFFNLFYFGLLPSFCMLLFGLFTFRNIGRSKRLLIRPSHNMDTTINQNNGKTNRELIRMLCFQVSIYCITAVAFSIGMIATSMNPNAQKNVFQVAQANMLNAVVGMLSNSGPNFSFYLFTLSSGLFRKELKKLFAIFYRNNIQVHPTRTQISHTNRDKTILMNRMENSVV